MNKKMTKVIILFVLLLSLINIFSSCQNAGFKDVVSVTYTVDGKTKTQSSTAYMTLGFAKNISKEEYESADSKYKVDFVSASLVETLTPYSKTVTSVDGFTNSDKGKYLYHRGVRFDTNKYTYNKYEITSNIHYNYIQVKVVDDDTIIIRDSNGDTTYNVSSYRITYFE